MLDDEFKKRRARLVRDLAEKADPSTKRRLLDLASRYEDRPNHRTPLPTVEGRQHPNHQDGGDSR